MALASHEVLFKSTREEGGEGLFFTVFDHTTTNTNKSSVADSKFSVFSNQHVPFSVTT